MPGQNLTQAEAHQRAETISTETYSVKLDLTGSDSTFRSESLIRFRASADATFLDLIAESVESVELNGSEIDFQYQDSRIEINGLQAENELRVVANCRYMHTGEGLHRFVDPVDDEAYVYSQFEVPDARRVYANFEQPDLKARFTFTVRVPGHWTVLSNAATPEASRNPDGSATYQFGESEKISTYITAIIAGPHFGVHDQLTSSDGRTIPLGVYCRQSLAEHLDADSILDITRKGFTYYENRYSRPYPFSKYDQVFVPEYNAGAMENAGCITFRDEYIFRSRPVAARVESRANTILHELAHMWFGDLVTMKWWNDLWLNESFAENMSYSCLAEGTQYADAWTGFNSRKNWGLRSDQLPTTHPIKAEITDLADVEVNFDGITYAKGAAVLRQLVAWVGRENFDRGLNSYFAAHEWSNATLDDLLEELEKASGRNLREWSRVWLEEAGITQLQAESTFTDGLNGRVVEALRIHQSLPMPGTSLRPQRLTVGGYSLSTDGAHLERIWRLETDIDGELSEVSEAAGLPWPELILINDEDLAYAKLRFDSEDLAFISENIEKFSDSLPRAVLLSQLWDAVRDGQFPASDYIQLALRALTTEEHSTVVQATLAQLRTALAIYLPEGIRTQVRNETSTAIRSLLESAKPGSDRQLQLAKTLSAISEGADTTWVAGFLNQPPAGLEIDTDLRWEIIQDLAAAGEYGEREIAQAAQEDATMRGAEQAAQARAALDPANAWQSVLSDKNLPNATAVAMMDGVSEGLRRRPQLGAGILSEYFGALRRIWQEWTHHIAEDIVVGLYPIELVGYQDVVGRTETWLIENQDADKALRRVVIENLDSARRALRQQQH
ncbi:MAG: aminopeptidase N [Varibaculum sp.]|nr:aminopeptidase N [Varibaculum sp.]